MLILLPPSIKECDYRILRGQTSSNLTKFLVKSISAYVSK